MITYEEVLKELERLSEEKFAAFQRRIIRDDKLKITGVRTPLCARLPKSIRGSTRRFRAFPTNFTRLCF